MRYIEQGETSDDTNPILDVWIQRNGVLLDPFLLEWRVLDLTSGGAVQIYPGSGWSGIDLTKLTLGHYVGTFDGTSKNPGAHVAEFRITIADGDATVTASLPFDVLVAGEKYFAVGLQYALLSDLRAEGVTVATVANTRALQSLSIAARMIEGFTNRVFGVMRKEMKLDGRGSADILIEEPIIALDSIRILTHAFGSEAVVDSADLDDVEIYNRHLRGLTDPDDRNDPRVSFRRLHDTFGQHYSQTRPLFPHHVFPFGQQNVVLDGAFGYTEADGSPVGSIPVMVRKACALLANKNALPAGVSATPGPAGPIVKERTRDQMVEYAKPTSLGGAQPGPFTGDAAIDNLILPFVRPAHIGAA